ncbi:MAG: HAMP domain-containing sensor histidine kinase [Planctomycetota bacterium]|nr:HAMP domain-containing sensor histidine kinase [Planctomycetota bacterium]MDA1211876.1 HAMP domain-containing sensor histidine kinase [Planctomycetota bacterium]
MSSTPTTRGHLRKRRPFHWPITLSAVLMTLNIALMVVWILLLARQNYWGILAVGTVVFSLILVGLAFYLVLTVKEVRLNQRQANFIDSVTHELKTPISSLRLYLETLQLRTLDETQRAEFYRVMDKELTRLDHLIDQLLEVGRLDALGHVTDHEDVSIEPLLRQCAASACVHHKYEIEEVFTFDIQPAVVQARRIVMEMIFGNILDNAVKYGANPPRVDVQVQTIPEGVVIIRVSDNGEGIPSEDRKKIFQIFYRRGSELERKKKGTGLGLYIARTLVHMLSGKITVHAREETSGTLFEIQLPGRAEAITE